jgi:hypothetical protein
VEDESFDGAKSPRPRRLAVHHEHVLSAASGPHSWMSSKPDARPEAIPLVVRVSACDDAAVVHAEESCHVRKCDESVRTAEFRSEGNWSFARDLPDIDASGQDDNSAGGRDACCMRDSERCRQLALTRHLIARTCAAHPLLLVCIERVGAESGPDRPQATAPRFPDG